MAKETEALTKGEASELAKRVNAIKTAVTKAADHINSIGEHLFAIRDKKLYRETHKTFEAFCQEMFGFSRRRANQLIEGQFLLAEMGNNFPNPPTKEAQVAALKGVPEDERGEVWEMAKAQTGKDQPSGADIKRAAQARPARASGNGAARPDGAAERTAMLEVVRLVCELHRHALAHRYMSDTGECFDSVIGDHLVALDAVDPAAIDRVSERGEAIVGLLQQISNAVETMRQAGGKAVNE